MYPVLFRLGPLVVTGYTALIYIGLLGAACITRRAARRRGVDPARALDAALLAALGGLLGARAAYVAAHWRYYSNHISQALALWNGGLAWHGALLGGLTALLLYCAIRHASPGQFLDILTPGVAWLTVSAWGGCLLSGCAYGIETYPDQRWLWRLSWEMPDLYGVVAPRVAVQLLGAGWGMVTLVIIVTIALINNGSKLPERHRWLNGRLFPLWLALYSAGSWGLGFLRGDASVEIAGRRLSQLVDGGLALGCSLLLVAGLIGPNRGSGPNKKPSCTRTASSK